MWFSEDFHFLFGIKYLHTSFTILPQEHVGGEFYQLEHNFFLVLSLCLNAKLADKLQRVHANLISVWTEKKMKGLFTQDILCEW